MAKRSVENVLIYHDYAVEFIEDLKGRFSGIRFHECSSREGLRDALIKSRAEVAFAGLFDPPFPSAEFFGCPSLEWLSLGFVGIDSLGKWDESRLKVTNAAGVSSAEMAQYVIAAIFGLYQRFPHFAKRQEQKQWDPGFVRSAVNARVGLIGLGKTGEAVAKLCKAVGLSVFACRATPVSSEAVDKLFSPPALYSMLSEVDVVVSVAALTDRTRNIIDAGAFQAMRAKSFFVNVGRGELVVEEALIGALRSGHLAGAVIDVTREEPLSPSNPLWEAPNLLITPHCSGDYEGWQINAANIFSENLERWLSGDSLQNVVSPLRGY